MKWSCTHIWEIDGRLVVVDTIEKAIEIFKAFRDNNHSEGPKEVHMIGNSDCVCKNYSALIEKS